MHPSRKSLPNSITLPNPHHFLYLRSIIVGFPLRLLVSLVETLALPSIIGLASIIGLDLPTSQNGLIELSGKIATSIEGSDNCDIGRRPLVITGPRN
jgi:hypothetical protein